MRMSDSESQSETDSDYEEQCHVAPNSHTSFCYSNALLTIALFPATSTGVYPYFTLIHTVPPRCRAKTGGANRSAKNNVVSRAIESPCPEITAMPVAYAPATFSQRLSPKHYSKMADNDSRVSTVLTRLPRTAGATDYNKQAWFSTIIFIPNMRAFRRSLDREKHFLDRERDIFLITQH